MKHYTASEIVRRARNLADLGNTDFISYEEEQQYLNDSWTEVYNSIISAGDKQFVEEVLLSGEPSSVGEYIEYDLPPNLYKICSIKDRHSGTIIPRAAESDPIGSATYDIINNKLRLYGKGSDLLLTYWLTPRTITHPDKDIAIEPFTGTIVSAAKNSILIRNGNQYTIRNLLTGSEHTLSIPSSNSIHLGNGHITTHTGTTAYWFDLNGMMTNSIDVNSPEDRAGYDHDWNIYYLANGKWRNGIDSLDWGEIKTIKRIDPPSAEEYGYCPAIGWENENSWYVINQKLPKVEFEYNDEAVTVPLEMKGRSIVCYTEYGYVSTDGTNYTLHSGIPDTLFNFPNEIFFSLMAANLAVRFLTKQNADSSGMNSIYENMLSTYRNSLSESGNYRVITNIY